MNLGEVIAALQHMYAAHGNMEVGVVGNANGKSGSLVDAGVVELLTGGRMVKVCLVSTEPIKCAGCEKCHKGLKH